RWRGPSCGRSGPPWAPVGAGGRATIHGQLGRAWGGQYPGHSAPAAVNARAIARLRRSMAFYVRVGADTGVERSDGGHVFASELEIVDGQVLSQPLLVGALGDRHEP